MTQLLVSVRNAAEAGEALAGGAQVIDVKEPQHGSLGAATPGIWRAVRAVVDDPDFPHRRPAISVRPVPLSAACGELTEWGTTRVTMPSAADLAEQLVGYAYAKVGLAGVARMDDWEQRWDAWRTRLPASTQPVAVVYADYRSASAPPPFEVIAFAARRGVQTLLMDTYDKSGGDLFTRLAACEVADVIGQAREEGMRIALAGSITLLTLSAALRFDPDIIAVRGAVCRRGRESQLAQDLVNRFRRRLSTPETGQVGNDAELPIDARSPRP